MNVPFSKFQLFLFCYQAKFYFKNTDVPKIEKSKFGNTSSISVYGQAGGSKISTLKLGVCTVTPKVLLDLKVKISQNKLEFGVWFQNCKRSDILA